MTLFAGFAPALAGNLDGGALPGLGAVIRIGGVISPGDETKFHELTQQLPGATVMLSGPGGAVDPAFRIGSEIRQLGLTTLVPADTSCASACALIWVAGSTRQLGTDGRIGLHAMSVGLANGPRKESHEHDGALRSYLTWLGFEDDTTATIVNTPATGVRWMDTQELNANGIDTQSVP